MKTAPSLAEKITRCNAFAIGIALRRRHLAAGASDRAAPFNEDMPTNIDIYFHTKTHKCFIRYALTLGIRKFQYVGTCCLRSCYT